MWRDALAPLAGQIDAAFLYGSMTSGRETGRSDVDVMVLGRAGFADIVRALAPTQVTLRREVNAIVMTIRDFARKHRQRDGFIASVLREPKLWLIGNDNDLAKLAQDRPLKPHSPSPQEIQRLLAAAERNLADARVEAISGETRFDAAYKAIMQSALVAMMVECVDTVSSGEPLQLAHTATRMVSKCSSGTGTPSSSSAAM